jgi:hypothetical protein
MNSGDAKKPKFDPSWWKSNKAKDADPKGAVEKALDKYVKAKKQMFELAKMSNSPRDEEVEKALAEIKKEALAEKANPKLGTFQKETVEALVNYAKLADAAIAELKRIDTAPIMKETVTFLVKQAPQFKEYCTKNFQAESYNFLSLMYKNPKKEKQWYEAFIKDGSKFQINIPASTKVPFDAIAKAVADGKKPDNPDTWGKAPWAKAVTDIEQMLTNDVLKRFRYFMCGVLMTGKLP